jgi:hypothetical protein
MIELKPYRGTSASTIEKGDKTRLGGELKQGKQAYPWHENPTLTTIFGCAFIIGLFVAVALTIITATPVWLCLFVMVCIFVIYIVNLLWQNYLGQYVGQPTLLVSAERAARGDDIEVRFRQPIRRNLLIEKGTIELLAREWVRYKCGTDTCTATHDQLIHIEIEQRARQLTAGEAYEQRVIFTIPSKAMHSFALDDNSLTWIIRVTVQSSGFLTLTESYAIQVTPEMHTL